jgi:hypothetical protein
MHLRMPLSKRKGNRRPRGPNTQKVETNCQDPPDLAFNQFKLSFLLNQATHFSNVETRISGGLSGAHSDQFHSPELGLFAAAAGHNKSTTLSEIRSFAASSFGSREPFEVPVASESDSDSYCGATGRAASGWQGRFQAMDSCRTFSTIFYFVPIIFLF